MENLFDALCSALSEQKAKQLFLDAEGPDLMILMIKSVFECQVNILTLIFVQIEAWVEITINQSPRLCYVWDSWLFHLWSFCWGAWFENVVYDVYGKGLFNLLNHALVLIVFSHQNDQKNRISKRQRQRTFPISSVSYHLYCRIYHPSLQVEYDCLRNSWKKTMRRLTN